MATRHTCKERGDGGWEAGNAVAEHGVVGSGQGMAEHEARRRPLHVDRGAPAFDGRIDREFALCMDIEAARGREGAYVNITIG